MNAASVTQEYNETAKLADSQEEICQQFVETALALWNRAFCHKEVLNAVRSCEERFGLNSPFEGISKLQGLMSKSGSPENVIWVFTSIDDSYTYGFIPKEGIPIRDILGTAPGKGGKGICA